MLIFGGLWIPQIPRNAYLRVFADPWDPWKSYLQGSGILPDIIAIPAWGLANIWETERNRTPDLGADLARGGLGFRRRFGFAGLTQSSHRGWLNPRPGQAIFGEAQKSNSYELWRKGDRFCGWLGPQGGSNGRFLEGFYASVLDPISYQLNGSQNWPQLWTIFTLKSIGTEVGWQSRSCIFTSCTLSCILLCSSEANICEIIVSEIGHSLSTSIPLPNNHKDLNGLL